MLTKIDEWQSNWNIFSATTAQRYTALIMSGIALFLWIIRGWDSGIGQYGVSLHYSVFVIYGLEYAIINWSLDSVKKIRGIRNLLISVLWTIFSVAVFEWYWGLSYALLHGELWVITPANTVFTELITITIIGVLGGLYAMKLGIRPTVDKLTLFMAMPAIAWLIVGFPQTCYPSVDSSVIYIENNLVHFYNVIAKLGLAFATARTLLHEHSFETRPQFALAISCALIWGTWSKIRNKKREMG